MKHNFFDSIIKDKATNHQGACACRCMDKINKKKKKRGIAWWLFAAVLIASSVVGFIHLEMNIM